MAEVPQETVDWILEHTGSTHGAVAVLDRWAAASAEIGRPLEAAWLPEVAPSVTASAHEEVVRRAKEVVAQHYGIPHRLLDAPTKVRRAGRPRRVAMYLVYRAAALPLKDLGHAFGLRSHSSVSRAIQQVREEREREPALEHEIDGLLARM
jgi:chromosomal replication initiation ATPase DnaA